MQTNESIMRGNCRLLVSKKGFKTPLEAYECSFEIFNQISSSLKAQVLEDDLYFFYYQDDSLYYPARSFIGHGIFLDQFVVKDMNMGRFGSFQFDIEDSLIFGDLFSLLPLQLKKEQGYFRYQQQENDLKVRFEWFLTN